MACAFKRLAERSLNAQQPSTQRGRRRVRVGKSMSRMASKKSKFIARYLCCVWIHDRKVSRNHEQLGHIAMKNVVLFVVSYGSPGKLGLRFAPSQPTGFPSLRVAGFIFNRLIFSHLINYLLRYLDNIKWSIQILD